MASRPEDVRLYCILPRTGSRAVVFRRGPSKSVLLVSWDLETDKFYDGQWFRGRIYERRCDLSPNGDLLLYFAANWREPYRSWSAISRPPYLTALALWPKGDGWGGGGHFKSDREIALNHRKDEMALADGFQTPRWFVVKPFGDQSGWGEDNPVWHERLVRDGWTLTIDSDGRADRKATVWITFDPPITYERKHPRWPERYVLRMLLRGIKERGGPWRMIDHELEDLRSREVTKLERSDWADWSPTGDLLYARHASLYRCSLERGVLRSPLSAQRLQDFSNREYQRRTSPPEAKRWPAK